MGGKTGTTTQSVSIPPEVLARYNAVNARAENVAATPFQPYQGQFVAGITPTQQAGINATTQYAQAAQPYYQAATGQLGQAQGQGQQAIQQAFGSLGQGVDVGQQYAQAATGGIGAALQYAQPYQSAATQAAFSGAQQLTPENINIQGYMSPYTQAVADTTYQALRQQQQQEMQGATANAIRAGAFGGDRAGLVAANLARQQQLGTAQAMAPIYQQGYGQALGTAMTAAQSNRAALQNLAQQLQGLGQQGYGQQMGAAQQLASLGQQQFGQGLGAAGQLGALGQQQYGMGAGTAQQLAALGTGAQQAALQGAQAQLGAGTLEQQTQQADLTARYQQFLQERGYPFQVAQFLANIAMGTGALSGSTTTTQQPMPFFSDRRVKDDVKEIGKTHDGLPIYSYKYKGDDATRIGLMAQDVEKKHPEAVYDMGGVKGVDYKQATEAAERPERYSGGLVPASQGGSVFEPGAYNRGGYLAGGLVDPNDVQALLAMQQESFGPFGEGGIYSGSQHNTPFAQAQGIVPKTRVHVPKLMQAGPAPKMQEGLGAQALGAYDQAMGMKKRYDEAKKMFEGEDTPQKKMDESRKDLTTREEVKNLAGPDIKSPKSVEEEKGFLARFGELTGLFAHGGVVPRDGFAVGGSKDPALPYEEDDKTPYKYFPTEILETEKPELAKAGQPPAQTSQTGIGLGTLLGLFLKDGGVVPRGRMANGGVYDPTMGRMVSTEMSPIEELNKEDVYSRELQPAAAPRFRTFERMAREGGADLKPNELFRTPERSAFLDLTMPEGAPRAKPYSSGHSYGLATDYSGITDANLPAVRAAAKATGLTLGEDFSNPDRPHVQYSTGSFGGLAPQYGKQIDLPPGTKDASFKGVVPPELQQAAYAKAQEVLASKGIEPTSKEGQSMMPQVVSFLEKNQGWLVPFGAGIRGMVQSKSPFLGAAVLEGLGTGMEAVGASQQQLADLARTRAGVIQTLSGISGPLIGQLDASGKPIYRPQYEFMPDLAKAPTEQLGETQKQVIEQSRKITQDPVVVKTDGGQYNWDIVPTSENLKTFASFGYYPTGNPYRDALDLRLQYQLHPDFAKGAIDDAEIAEARKKQAVNTPQTKRETNALTTALMNLPEPGTVAGGGPGFDQRTYAINVYNWVSKFFGSDAIDFNSDEMKSVTAQEISKKIQTLLSSRISSEQGFNAQQMAEDIRRALPGGDLTTGARAEMLASMWVANQELEDFPRYYQAYVREFKTTYGVNQAFQKDMAPKYDAMKAAIKKAITPLTYTDEEMQPDGTKKMVRKTAVDPATGLPLSEYNFLMNENDPIAFDELVKMPGLARVFRGG